MLKNSTDYSKEDRKQMINILIDSFELHEEKLRNINTDISKLKEELFNEK